MKIIFPILYILTGLIGMMGNRFIICNQQNFLEVVFNSDSCKLSINLDIVFFLILFVLLITTFIFIRYFRHQKNYKVESIPVEMTYNLAGMTVKYNIKRSYDNIEIAYRIYIELITRKAAIEFDEEHDVIVEIYNSWYSLFSITREEIKKFPGNLLGRKEGSEELIRLTTDILNKGLRPHLTTYQAKFRKWYSERMQSNDPKYNYISPQEIQKEYPYYSDLILSMKESNRILIEYSKNLKLFVDGNE